MSVLAFSGKSFNPGQSGFRQKEFSNFTEEELMDYESDMKRFSDHANALAYAKEKGIAIGESRGEAKGEVRGLAIGVKKGILQTAKSMLKEGFNPTLVARITKLPRKEVLALR